MKQGNESQFPDAPPRYTEISPSAPPPPTQSTNPAGPASSNPANIGTTRLVGELASRAAKGAVTVLKAGIEAAVVVGEAVSTSSRSTNGNQPLSNQYQPLNQPITSNGYHPPSNYGPSSTPYVKPQSYPGQGYPVQGYPVPNNPAQSYPGQGYPAQGYPAQNYPSATPARGDYWSPLVSWDCWWAMIFFIFIDFPWSIFCFVWCLTTMLLGIALLVIFPIGYPLLYVFSLSWRALAHMQVILLHWNSNVSPIVFSHPVYLRPQGQYQHDTFPFKRHLGAWYTWKSALYFIFYNIWFSLWTFIFCIIAVTLGFPMICCLSMWLNHGRECLGVKRRFSRKILG
jgi:hypothetical protein